MATVEGSPWRLKAIIIIVIYFTLIYGAYGVFGNIQTADEYNKELFNYTYNESATIGNGSLDSNYNYDSSEGQSFIDMITGIGEFASFGQIDNWAIRMMFNALNVIFGIVLGYIIYTFIRDWVPLVG